MDSYRITEDLQTQLQLSSHQISDLKNAFSLFDNGKGRISKDDFENLSQSLGLRIQHFDDISEVSQGKDEIDFEQFLKLATQSNADHNSTHQTDTELRQAFNHFDSNHKGYLSVNDLKEVMIGLGDQSVTDDEAAEMMKEADLNHDSHISFEEFRFVMSRQLSEHR